MLLEGRNIGYAVTGSFCTLDRAMTALQAIVDVGASVIPIASPAVVSETTRFGPPGRWLKMMEAITGAQVRTSFAGVEPIGPERLADAVVVAPCTGATLARIAAGLSDTPVAMAVKAQLRNNRPVVLAISTNDGLGLNARNLGVLLAVRNVYFVPFGQDNPEHKPNSLDADFGLLVPTIVAALANRQIQPILTVRTAIS